jgi:hypothetical protein
VVGGTARSVGAIAGATVAAPLTIVEQSSTARKPATTVLEDTLHDDPQSRLLTQ